MKRFVVSRRVPEMKATAASTAELERLMQGISGVKIVSNLMPGRVVALIPEAGERHLRSEHHDLRLTPDTRIELVS